MSQTSLSDSKSAEASFNKKDGQQYKRLTIDIPVELHRTIKSQCALRGTKIADEVRQLLFEKYLKPVDDNNT
ncbi:MAG: hypothetical protein EBR59_06570 [Methylococcaceae bacterium]|nr:hypothetical protein [Methylococcaceae bacterium]